METSFIAIFSVLAALAIAALVLSIVAIVESTASTPSPTPAVNVPVATGTAEIVVKDIVAQEIETDELLLNAEASGDARVVGETTSVRISALPSTEESYSLFLPAAKPTGSGVVLAFDADGVATFAPSIAVSNVAAGSIVGRRSGSSGIPEALTLDSTMRIAGLTLGAVVMAARVGPSSNASVQYTSVASALAAGFSSVVIVASYEEPSGFTLTRGLSVRIMPDVTWTLKQTVVGDNGIDLSGNSLVVEGAGFTSIMSVQHDGGSPVTVFQSSASTQVDMRFLRIETDDKAADGFLFGTSQQVQRVWVRDSQIAATSNTGTGVVYNIGQTNSGIYYLIDSVEFVGTLPVGTASNVVMLTGNGSLDGPNKYTFNQITFIGEMSNSGTSGFAVDLSGSSFERSISNVLTDAEHTQDIDYKITGTGWQLTNLNALGAGASDNFTIASGRAVNMRIAGSVTITTTMQLSNCSFSNASADTFTIGAVAPCHVTGCLFNVPIVINGPSGSHLFDGCALSFVSALTINAGANLCQFVNCQIPSVPVIGTTVSSTGFNECQFTSASNFDVDAPSTKFTACRFSGAVRVNNASGNTGTQIMFTGNRFLMTPTVTTGGLAAADLPLFVGNNFATGAGAATGPANAHANSIGNC